MIFLKTGNTVMDGMLLRIAILVTAMGNQNVSVDNVAALDDQAAELRGELAAAVSYARGIKRARVK